MSGEHRVFLETSIQIDRLVQDEERKGVIRQNLLDRKIFTSSYVLMEFRRTILQDVCFVHSIVDTDCEEDVDGFLFLSQVARALASGKGNYSPRSAWRSHLVTAAVLDKFYPFSEAPKSELLEFLDFQVEQLERDFFEVDDPNQPDISITCVDETDCDLTKGSSRCRISKMSCARKRAKCKLPQFLEAHSDELIGVRNAFEEALKEKALNKTQTEGAERAMKAADRVVTSDTWDIAKGQKNCWTLGDMIIALEAPKDAPIYTKDRHFDVICPAIGKKTYQEI